MPSSLVEIPGLSVDTSKPLSMFEAYQKACIVNDSVMKIVDMGNIMIETTISDYTGGMAGGESYVVPERGSELVQATTGASLVVDYVVPVDTDDDGTYDVVRFYGYQITEAAFDMSNTVTWGTSNPTFTPTDVKDKTNYRLATSALATAPTVGDVLTQVSTGAQLAVTSVNSAKTVIVGEHIAGTNSFNTSYAVSSSGTGSVFTPTEVWEQGTPLYYDWQPYPDLDGPDGGGGSVNDSDWYDSTEFGDMPRRATLAVLYRGAALLSGNTDYPNEWYKSRKGNIFDFNYTKQDINAAAAGTPTYLGQIGDAIKALIPYKDDYCLFGCNNSWWVMRGDPGVATSIDQIDYVKGIFSKDSWCWDGKGNLFAVNYGGVQIIPYGFTATEMLTQDIIPDFKNDFPLNPNEHRVSMEYDQDRAGILITKTLLSDGSNENLWLSLKSRGFFNEVYPKRLAVYCQHYYDADTPGNRHLLLGTKEGYVCRFEETAKNDDGEPIVSKIIIGPGLVSARADKDAIVQTLKYITGDNTDKVEWELYGDLTAESVIKDVEDETSPDREGSFSGSGQSKTIRPRLRTTYIGLAIGNDEANQTWALEKILGTTRPTGRVK